jgi:hypothetical protein
LVRRPGDIGLELLLHHEVAQRHGPQRVRLRHELTMIVSVYGPKVIVEAPKDAVSPLGLDPDEFALIVTLPVL